jgi:hypothetical protein
VLPQMGETLFAPRVEFGGTPWRNPLWLVAETLRGAARGLPGGWVGLGLGASVAVAGTISFARRSAATAALMLLPPVLTAGALLAMHHNLWPRFFFFAAGFAVLIAVRGVTALAGVVLKTRADAVATVVLLLVAAASAFTVPRAWGAKQDYEGALAYVTSQRRAGDAVGAAGLASFALQEYLHAGEIRSITDEAELNALEAAGRSWLLYSFPTHLAAAEPDVWARVQREYRRVAEFPGTLGGGTVYVMSRP